MATTLNCTYNPNQQSGVVVASWPALANGESGVAAELAQYSDRSVQFQGTFGAAGSVQLEGSNDGSNWHLLTDPQGNDIVKTAADLEQVSELTRYIRPRCTAGDGTTALAITVVARR